MTTIGFIPIRTGSKRFQKKNFSKFLDTTLLQNTVDKLIKAGINKIYISTDDFEAVKDFAVINKFKDKVIIFQRPHELASDETITDLVVNDFIHQIGILYDDTIVFTIVLCQVTSPNWSAHRLIYALHRHEEKNKVVISVSPNYEPNGCFYIFTKEQFEHSYSILNNDLYLVVLNWDESIDIDYSYQLHIAEAIATNSKDEN